jgi:hypothetical protein
MPILKISTLRFRLSSGGSDRLCAQRNDGKRVTLDRIYLKALTDIPHYSQGEHALPHTWLGTVLDCAMVGCGEMTTVALKQRRQLAAGCDLTERASFIAARARALLLKHPAAIIAKAPANTIANEPILFAEFMGAFSVSGTRSKSTSRRTTAPWVEEPAAPFGDASSHNWWIGECSEFLVGRSEVPDQVRRCDDFPVLGGSYDPASYSRRRGIEVAVEGIRVERMIVGYFRANLDLRREPVLPADREIGVACRSCHRSCRPA